MMPTTPKSHRVGTRRVVTLPVGFVGWRAYSLLMAAGALMTLTVPPFHAWPLLIPAFVIFLNMNVSARNTKEAFLRGCVFAFGYHVTSLYWISYSLLVEPERYAWLIPFAVSLIPALLSLLTGVVAAALYRFNAQGWRRVVMLAVLWMLADILRTYGFQFPWIFIGNALSVSAAVEQIASLVGIHGMTLLTVIAASSPWLLMKGQSRHWRTLAISVCILGAAYVWGAERLKEAHTLPESGIHVRIVQADIPQQMKWEDEERLRILAAHLELTSRPSDIVSNIVIWPEVALPLLLEPEPEVRRMMGAALPSGAVLITGAVRAREFPYQLWNSVQALNGSGDIIATYDKHWLVPFGEFVPLRSILPFLNKITPGETDFSRGKGVATLTLPGIPPFSPLVCYEAAFSGQVASREQRPAWLLNVTNDAWFGDSIGPLQHLAIARIRAIEEGLPLVRAANTGISAVVDSYGVIQAFLSLHVAGTIDRVLPPALSNPTPYAKYGMAIPCGMATLLLVIALRRRK